MIAQVKHLSGFFLLPHIVQRSKRQNPRRFDIDFIIRPKMSDKRTIAPLSDGKWGYSYWQDRAIFALNEFGELSA